MNEGCADVLAGMTVTYAHAIDPKDRNNAIQVLKRALEWSDILPVMRTPIVIV